MASDLYHQMKNIDVKDRDLINGYIRENEKNVFQDQKDNPYYNIPGLINYLCLSFWYDLNEFDPNLCGKTMEISEDCKLVSAINEEFSSCFGKKVIESTNNNATYIWKFQNVSTLKERDEFINIGICNVNIIDINTAFHWLEHQEAWYAYFNGGDAYSWNGVDSFDWPQALNNNDDNGNIYIVMTLKLMNNTGQLSFKINENEDRIAFKDIKVGEDIQYRLAVSMCEAGSKLQLLEFKVVH